MTEQTKSENTALTIGEVARLTGLTERALRHYEAEGSFRPCVATMVDAPIEEAI